MPSAVLSFLLSIQMFLSTPAQPVGVSPRQMAFSPNVQVEVNRLWCGLIDPETSLWFSRIPDDVPQLRTPVLWDFSWRGFLAALFGQSVVQEDAVHAPLA